MLSQRRRGEVYIGKTVDDVAEVNISLLHTAEASSVLGTLMRLCIYVATGSQAHGRNFQGIAQQCGLVPLEGTWATAGYPDATTVPSWVRVVLKQLGPWPAPRLQIEDRKKKQPSRWITVVCEACSCRWKSSALHLEAPIRCPHEGCDGEQAFQRPDDTDSTPDAEGPGVTFRSAKHAGKSYTRPSWFPGKVISARQAHRVFNKLCGQPACRCRYFAASGASLEEVRDSVPGLGRQFVVRPAQQTHEKRTRCLGVAKGAAASSVDPAIGTLSWAQDLAPPGMTVRAARDGSTGRRLRRTYQCTGPGSLLSDGDPNAFQWPRFVTLLHDGPMEETKHDA